MRRPLRVARTTGILIVIGVLASVSGGVLARAALVVPAPPTRIKVDPATQDVNLSPPTAVTLTATVVDWKNGPIAGIKVQLTVLSGPDTKTSASGVTGRTGQVALTYKNTGGPGVDVVQATFSDGLETHKSNRPFVNWLSGQPATAIRSPATISITPDCFQPLTAAALASDQLTAVQPVPSPSPSATPAPTYAIQVTGDNFNPFTAVLVTFDAGPGGRPQSFQAKTDGFGHFALPINPSTRAEGTHLVRADDFREREATATFTLPCFQPSLALNPAIGPPGYVPIAYGSGYPANSPIVLLAWDPGLTASVICLDANGNPKLDANGAPQASLQTDGKGAFACEVLVLYHDQLGPRLLRAIVPNPKGPDAGAAIEADAPFLVTPGRQQPPDFVYRR
ncbi:MAG TPA: hypothetical protein VET65_01425 [Candidatus Limnocylindrales bacterium]|nr:hypothetical protein [Candidatus Limnocylindrales bacterium]